MPSFVPFQLQGFRNGAIDLALIPSPITVQKDTPDSNAYIGIANDEQTWRWTVRGEGLNDQLVLRDETNSLDVMAFTKAQTVSDVATVNGDHTITAASGPFVDSNIGSLGAPITLTGADIGGSGVNTLLTSITAVNSSTSAEVNTAPQATLSGVTAVIGGKAIGLGVVNPDVSTWLYINGPNASVKISSQDGIDTLLTLLTTALQFARSDSGDNYIDKTDDAGDVRVRFGTAAATGLRVANAHGDVNNIALLSGTTGNGATVQSEGSDNNVPLILKPKGASPVNITSLPAFASGDKFLVCDSNGNIHVSGLGPVS